MAEAKTEKGGKPAKADKAAAKGGKAEAPEAKAAKGKGRPTQTEVASAGQPKAPPKDYVARFKKLYESVIVPKLVAEFVQMGARYVSTGTDLAFLLGACAQRAKQVRDIVL